MNFQSLAAEFAEEALDLIDQLESSLLTFEKERGTDPRRLGAIRRTLHTLKGNAGMVGARALQAIFHHMEDAAHRLGEDDEVLAVFLVAIDRLRPELRALREGREVEPPSQHVAALAEAGLFASKETETEVEPSLEDLSLRVPQERIDHLAAAAGELLVQNTRLQKLLGGGSRDLREAADSMQASVRGLHRAVLGLRMIPVGPLFHRYRRIVRDESLGQEKEAELVIEGGDVELDKKVLDRLGEILGHVVRNAVVHGIEGPDERAAAGKPRRGTITLAARPHGGTVEIVVSDDGKGLDEGAILEKAAHLGLDPQRGTASLVFEPGVSTASLSRSAGRGVGLDAVQRSVIRLGGTLEVHSTPGVGTAFFMRVPSSIALERALLCSLGDEVYALPTSNVVEASRVERKDVRRVGGGSTVEHRGAFFPLVDTEPLLGVGSEGGYAVFVRTGSTAVLRVDGLLGQQDFIFQPLDPALASGAPVDSAALLADGSIVLRLDPDRLVRAATEVRP